jgi:uncharacterized membrane protein
LRRPGELPCGVATLPKPVDAALSGILEREPGGVAWACMFFHMVKMMSCCVCE